MHKLGCSFLAALLFICMLPSYALQVKSVKDNQTVMFKVSSKELSRIFISGDRIMNVRGLEGDYDLKRDDSLGEIYVQPSPYSQHKAFNLFLTTEKGHIYNLLLTSLDIPSETIEIKPLSPSLKLADKWEKNSPYQQLLIDLIKDMSNGTQPNGIAVIDMGKTKFIKLNPSLSMRLLVIYRGYHLQGEIWQIKNESAVETVLHPHIFYKNAVRAISIANEKLLPKGETILYKVMEHG